MRISLACTVWARYLAISKPIPPVPPVIKYTPFCRNRVLRLVGFSKVIGSNTCTQR